MGARSFSFLLALCLALAAASLCWLPDGKAYWACVPLALAAISLVLLYRRVVMPSVAASRGLELIAAQDFNNTLTPVGERNADRVVKLFNEIIQKLRNERLQNLERESFLNLLIEASPMGVLLMDFDGKVSMANRAFLSISGLESADGVIGKKISDLPDDLSISMQHIPLGESGELCRGDAMKWRCYHLSFVQTGFKRHFYLLESLTEEVMAAERKAYEKIIRTLSHEVNNTMGGVKSVLDLMYESTDEGDVKEVIESCTDRCDRMCSFISSYADVVRLPEPVFRKVDLVSETSRLLPFLQEVAGSSIDVSLNIQAPRVMASLDMTLMQQAMVNIVKNAAESITDKGYIEISIGMDNKSAVLEISNNGAPISEETSRQLFTPFFTTKRQGRGLGLTLIAEILRKHGASFRLYTDQAAITKFRINLHP